MKKTTFISLILFVWMFWFSFAESINPSLKEGEKTWTNVISCKYDESQKYDVVKIVRDDWKTLTMNISQWFSTEMKNHIKIITTASFKFLSWAVMNSEKEYQVNFISAPNCSVPAATSVYWNVWNMKLKATNLTLDKSLYRDADISILLRGSDLNKWMWVLIHEIW